MTISKFKLRTHVTQGVDVSSPSAQASEIAAMIGANSFSVDATAGAATFIVDEEGGPRQYTVTVGQVISISGGYVSVVARDSFLKTYELDE